MKKRNTFKARKSVPHWKRPRIPKKIMRERNAQTELEVQMALASLRMPSPSQPSGKS